MREFRSDRALGDFLVSGELESPRMCRKNWLDRKSREGKRGLQEQRLRENSDGKFSRV